MKKNLILLTTIFMMNITSAQNNDKIIGLYNLGSSAPEGGSHLFVLENGKYAITYFGGIQIGQWKFLDKETCQFTPNTKEQEFELFGRHNKDLNDSIKIFFNGFEESETFIHTGVASEEGFVMKRVFNVDANCFSFPYTHTFKTSEKSISFMSKEYNEKSNPIITFKIPKDYNDFVAYFFHKDSDVRPFSARFEEDKLYFDDKNYSQKVPLDENDEDIKFIKEFVNKEEDMDKVYCNPFYNLFEGDINKHHVFNEQKGAFIDAKFYVEGEEYTKSDESFDNMSIIYVFERLTDFTIKRAKHTIDETPLFYVICD